MLMVRLNKLNYEKIYNVLCSSRKHRGHDKEEGYEIHHIIPRSWGGDNNKTNLVKLNHREHYVAHKLLTKFAYGYKLFKMNKALSLMSGSGKYPNSWSHSRSKERSDYLIDVEKGYFIVNPYCWKFRKSEGITDLEATLHWFIAKKVKGLIVPSPNRMYPLKEGLPRNKLTRELQNLSEKGLVVVTQRTWYIKEIRFTDKLLSMCVKGRVLKGLTTKDFLYNSDRECNPYSFSGNTVCIGNTAFKNPTRCLHNTLDLRHLYNSIAEGVYAKDFDEIVAVDFRKGVLPYITELQEPNSQVEWIFNTLYKDLLRDGRSTKAISLKRYTMLTERLSPFIGKYVAVEGSLFGIARRSILKIQHILSPFCTIVDGRFFQSKGKASYVLVFNKKI